MSRSSSTRCSVRPINDKPSECLLPILRVIHWKGETARMVGEGSHSTPNETVWHITVVRPPFPPPSPLA
jgi:hypothetical protein